MPNQPLSPGVHSGAYDDRQEFILEPRYVGYTTERNFSSYSRGEVLRTHSRFRITEWRDYTLPISQKEYPLVTLE